MGISPNIMNISALLAVIFVAKSIFLEAPIFLTAEFYFPKLEAIFNLESYRPQVVVKHIGTSQSHSGPTAKLILL